MIILITTLIMTSILTTKCIKMSRARDSEPFLAEDFKMNFTSDDELTASLTPQETYRLKVMLRSIAPIDQSENRLVTDASAYCKSLNKCDECIRAMWYPCGWCHNYGCTHIPELLCPQINKHAGKQNAGEIAVCPSISHEGPLLIQIGKVNIQVNIYGTDSIIFEKEIICMVKLKQKVILVKGVIFNDVVHCFPFHVDQLYNKEQGTFRLIWGGVIKFSNEIPVVVYSCESLAHTCDGCRIVSIEYNMCSWCDGTQLCVTSDKCKDFVKWSLSRVTCDTEEKKLFYV